jgi:phage major head subunit gpT-like protein
LSVVKYGLGFSISEEAVEDGKFDMIADAIQKMAKSALETQEISAMNILNNGFTTELAADGLTIFNASHTLPSGLTFRNQLSTAADLSQSSLDQALTDFETQFVGDSGIIYRAMPRILLVHPSQRRYAMELVGSDLKPDSADNNMNSLKGEGLVVVSSPHLTDTDAWFLLADKAETGLRIVNRSGIQTKASDEAVGFMNDSIFYKSRYREVIGVTHAYGIFGSSGA